jgi:non-heme chloroperoxidase
MAPIPETVRLSSGLTLSYAAQGDESGPVVVFLPGPTDAWSSYTPVLERLPLSIRSLAISQRGHGNSDKPANGYRVEDFAADVASFLDGLSIDRAVLVGHSGSCLVARRVAIDHPERVAGMLLEASPTTLRGNSRLEHFIEIASMLQDPIDTAFARSFVADTSSDSLDPDLLDQLIADVVKVPARVWQAIFSALLDYDDMAELDSVTAPTQLVWGDADGLIDRGTQESLVARLGSARLAVYEGVGHTPRWEEPERFAGDVYAVVERSRHPGSDHSVARDGVLGPEPQRPRPQPRAPETKPYDRSRELRGPRQRRGTRGCRHG